MQTTGGCFCGAIEYEADVDETRVGVCHCRDCQIFSGSAFRMAAVIDPSSFRFTKGTPRFFDKTADSGKVRRMAFCGDCGTHICSLPADASEGGGFVSLRVATSGDFAKIKPTGELWCKSKVRWLPEIEGTFKFDGQP